MDNGGDINAENSPWVQRAHEFIDRAGNPSEQVEVVRFLLENGNCGIENTIKINEIVEHVNDTCGTNYTKSPFQTNILGPLKRERIVTTLMYSGPRSGAFIPLALTDVIEVVTQGLRRIRQELINLQGFASDTEFENVIINLLGLL